MPAESMTDESGSISIPILPSPAPSDELRQDPHQIIELNDDEHLAEGRLAQHDAVRLKELADKYGGIEGLERHLLSADSVTNPQPVTPVSQDPQDLSAGPNASNKGFPSSRHRSANEDTLLRRRSGNSTASRTLKRGIESDVASKKRNCVGAKSIRRGPDQLLPESPTTPVIDAAQNRSLSNGSARPSTQQMPEFEQKLGRRMHIVEADARSPGDIEVSRLRLLKEACASSDVFYLLLHQIYCLDPETPDGNRQLLDLAFGSGQYQGLAILTNLLVPNSELKAYDKATRWFSTFPRPLNVLLNGFQVYRVALEKLRVSLAKLASNWSQHKDMCHKRHYPPLVDDLSMTLGIDSPTLQKVIFTAIYRDIWIGDSDQCFAEGDNLFRQSQHFIQQRMASATQSPQMDLQAYYQKLIMSYQSLWSKHCQHSQPQSQNLVENNTARSMSSMAPPQPAQAPTKRPLCTPNTAYTGRAFPSNINTQVVQNTPLRNAEPPSSARNSQMPPMHPNNSIAYPSSTPTSISSPVLPRYGRVDMNSQGLPSSYPPADSYILRSNTANEEDEQQQHRRTSSAAALPNFSRQAAQQHANRQQVFRPGQAPSPHLNTPTPRLSTTFTDQFIPYTDTVHQHVQNQHLLSSLPLLPPAGQTISNTSQANPVLTALHQAHVRSPLLLPSRQAKGQGNRIKYYRYTKGVVVIPHRLKLQVRHHFRWNFDIHRGNFDLLSGTIESNNGAPPSRVVHVGSRFCRIKCIDATKLGDPIPEVDWVIANHIWPTCITILLNGKPLEVRKRAHHGKDLPVDVTQLVIEGKNTLSISILRTPTNERSAYAIGLETIELTDTDTIKAEIQKTGWMQAQQRIMDRFSNADPEVQVVDSSVILDLTDPYTSQIFGVAVRGKACRHNQCFDLDIFLQTRTSKAPDQPCDPDQFKCPICGADARPQSLIEDGYFMALRGELARMDRLDAKAITLHQDGKWNIKEQEETGEAGDGSGKRLTARREGSTAALQKGSIAGEVEVIEIDDD